MCHANYKNIKTSNCESLNNSPPALVLGSVTVIMRNTVGLPGNK